MTASCHVCHYPVTRHSNLNNTSSWYNSLTDFWHFMSDRYKHLLPTGCFLQHARLLLLFCPLSWRNNSCKCNRLFAILVSVYAYSISWNDEINFHGTSHWQVSFCSRLEQNFLKCLCFCVSSNALYFDKRLVISLASYSCVCFINVKLSPLSRL
jgi:hypothetical protein